MLYFKKWNNESFRTEVDKLIKPQQVVFNQCCNFAHYRAFPRPFTHGGDLSPPYGGGTSAGGQSVNRGDS